MNKKCTENILQVIELGQMLIACADRGDRDRQDDSCGVLFGITRDAAYRIIELAQQERERHIRRGTWDISTP